MLEEEVLELALQGAVPGLQEELPLELAQEVLVRTQEAVVLGLELGVLEEEVLVRAQNGVVLCLERAVLEEKILVGAL